MRTLLWIYRISCGLALLAALALLGRWWWLNFHATGEWLWPWREWWTILLPLAPAGLLAFGVWLSQKKRPVWAHGLLIAGTAVSLAPILWMAFVVEFVAELQTVTNLRRYEEIVAQWHPEHFPNRIPTTASHARFAYSPGFLQGGSFIQLRYTIAPDEIARLHERFSQQATVVFHGGETNEYMNHGDFHVVTPSFYTGHTGGWGFPKDYEVMIFDPIHKGDEPIESQNHGSSQGVSISRQRNEIVYWAETW